MKMNQVGYCIIDIMNCGVNLNISLKNLVLMVNMNVFKLLWLMRMRKVLHTKSFRQSEVNSSMLFLLMQEHLD